MSKYLTLPYLAFRVGRLLHLPSAEAISVQPNAHPQEVKVTKGYVNGCKVINNNCEAVNNCQTKLGIKTEN